VRTTYSRYAADSKPRCGPPAWTGPARPPLSSRRCSTTSKPRSALTMSSPKRAENSSMEESVTLPGTTCRPSGEVFRRPIERAISERGSGPILLNTRGVRMDRHAAIRDYGGWRRCRLCDCRGCTRICCVTPSSSPCSTQASICAMYRSPPAMPTLGRRCATTGPATTSTATQLHPRRLHGIRDLNWRAPEAETHWSAEMSASPIKSYPQFVAVRSMRFARRQRLLLESLPGVVSIIVTSRVGISPAMAATPVSLAASSMLITG
jgi:hypothetical protein